MKTVYYTIQDGCRLKDGTAIKSLKPCVATIGFFDGVHRGHQYLIRQLVEKAHSQGLEATVITFDEHPRKVLQSDYQPESLSTLDSKLRLLSRTDIDNVVVLHFDKEMASLSAKEFMSKVLCNQLSVKSLFIGYDHRFGRNREETFDDYVRYGREMNMEVVRNDAFQFDGINVSSSVVTSGYHEGRKIGFPTANIDISHLCQMIPAAGVYAVKVRLEQGMEMKWGMMNIGTRPTFGGKRTTIETHIFHFDGDIYGQLLLVSFVHRIRGERKFESPEELAEQLREDEETVVTLLQKDKENE